MKRQIAALRKRLWRDMAGCECRKVIMVDDIAVTLMADEMCTHDAVRCNGRYARIFDDYKKNGLKIGPVSKDESGLEEPREAT